MAVGRWPPGPNICPSPPNRQRSMGFQRLIGLALPSLLLLSTSGCDQPETTPVVEETAATFRAAEVSGSCVSEDYNSCGGQSPDGCWCDDNCAEYGDCCGDKTDVCTMDGSCNLRCGEKSGSCWCDENCATYGDCCEDYVAECVEPPPAPTCEGFCGEQAEAGCWCDDQCAEYGDCCEDKVPVCDPPPPIDQCDGECGPDQTCEQTGVECEGPLICLIQFGCVDNDDPCGGECRPDQTCSEITIGDGTIGATVWGCLDSCEPLGPCGLDEECRVLPLNCGPDGTGCSSPFIWQQCFPEDTPPPCDGECLPGQSCAFLGASQEAECITLGGPTGCAAMLCPEGTACIEDPHSGEGECVPNLSGDQCEGFECPADEVCVVAPICNDAGICLAYPGPQCVPQPLPPECAAITCLVGHTCGVNPDTGIVGCLPPA